MATLTTTGVRYFAIFLCLLIFVSVAMILAWVTNNSGNDSKRGGSLWILTTIGQCAVVGDECISVIGTSLIIGTPCGFVVPFGVLCVLWRRI